MVDLPASDRPRERLWSEGVEALADRELLALILRTGSKGRNALDLAVSLLSDSGGLKRLSRITPEELARVPGVGLSKAAMLTAMFELSRRMSRAPLEERRPIRRPADIAALVLPRLGRKPKEEALVVVLDGSRRTKRLVPVSSGCVDRALLPVREVLSAVLRNDGVAFGLAHNHPSGDPSPSREDWALSDRVGEAAAVIGLRFLDHVIIGESTWVSLREAEIAASRGVDGSIFTK